MSRAIRQHLHSNIVGYIALFCFAMGGTAYATHPGGANTISTGDIQDGQVQNPDLGINSISSSKVLPSTLIGADIATNTLTSSDIGTGAVGSSEVADNSLGTTEFASSIPVARITRTGAQGINNITTTTVNFNSEDYDTASMHSTSSNLNRLTAPVTGIYEVSAHIDWDTNGSGYRNVCLRRNGSAPPCLAHESASGSATGGSVWQNVSTVERLTAGDYVDISVYQTSGGLRNFTPEASMTWLAPGP